MAKAMDSSDKIPTIDNRILAAIKRNQEYLGLTEWLVRYSEPAGSRSAKDMAR
jgi:hypothetical protein